MPFGGVTRAVSHWADGASRVVYRHPFDSPKASLESPRRELSNDPYI